jgi:hypothetical protein
MSTSSEIGIRELDRRFTGGVDVALLPIALHARSA